MSATKIYLSGPLDDAPALEVVAIDLRLQGAEVRCVLDVTEQEAYGRVPGQPYDLDAVLDANEAFIGGFDLVVVAGAWEDCPGTLSDVMTAEAVGVPWVPFDEMLQAAP